ncbi:MAG: M15 family metallopeptidase [Clostridiales bacterium]|nr:M15 family metallopeptidase [Clostridiales bacterium]
MLVKVIAILTLFLNLSQTTIDNYVAQTNLGGYLYLVNQTYQLGEDYIPGDLQQPAAAGNSSGTLMRKQAADHLDALFASAKEAGYTLIAVSGYRSFATQRNIYSRKLSSGAKNAKLYVAPPGASEHQLGLAMDLGRKGKTKLNAAFGSSDEGAWVAENAHRFGFIIRYKDGWQDITGYAPEPWHVRYVSQEHAQHIFELDIPLEQYVEQLSLASFGEYFMEEP